MNDRQITCFLEVGRLLNFTKAAENLQLAQPAVSRYVLSLEEELGCQLFLRENSRKVFLTDAGKIYYNIFHQMQVELLHAKRMLSSVSAKLRIGINKSWNTEMFLPAVIERCQRLNPNLEVSFDCFSFHELSTALMENRLDVILSLENYVKYTDEIIHKRITSINRAIVFSSRLKNADQIQSPADFAPYDFFILDDPFVRRNMRQNDAIFQAYHFIPRFKTVSNTETMIHYAESGYGVALLDQWCYALMRPHLKHMFIDDYLNVVVAWQRKTDTAAVSLFCKVLCEYFLDANGGILADQQTGEPLP